MKPHPNQGPEKLVSKSISIPVVERAGANPSHSGRGRGEAPFRTPQGLASVESTVAGTRSKTALPLIRPKLSLSGGSGCSRANKSSV